MSTTAVPSKMPEDFALNIENLDKFTNSTSSTFTDRLGGVKKTIVGVLAEYPNASGNAANAAASAGASETSRQASAAQAVISATQAGLAAQYQAGSELARDQSMLSVGMKDDTPAGLAATVNGQYFTTPGAAGGATFSTLWKNVANQAVEQIRSPSTKVLEQFVQYTGVGPVYPIATDKNNRIIFGFDESKQSLVGEGLVTSDAIPPAIHTALAGYSELVYTGTGPVWPLIAANGNKVLLGFDEATQKLVGPGIGDAAAVPVLMPIAKVINHLLFYGQSLSVGAQGTPILSTTQPYSNITFSGGPRAWTGSANDFTAFKPLVEDAVSPAPDGSTGRGETPCSGAANYASTLAAVENGVEPASHVILASTAGHGGYRIDQLNKGTAWYDKLILHISSAKALNADYAVHAFAWMQGENDAVAGTQTPYVTYRAKLAQLQTDVEADALAISGQKSPVFCLTYQMSYAARTWPDQAKAQLDLAQKNSKFVLVTPTYHLPHATDNVHLTAVGYKWIGGYFGRAYKQLVHDGKKMQWLNPLSATRRGAVIRVRFAVPTLPLVLDTTTLAVTTDKGFKVLDGASAATISSIAVDGSDVVITLSAVPADVVKVRYALDYIGAGLTITGGGSGNLRDSTPETYLVDGIARPLYHVCPHVELTATLLGE